MRNPGAYGEQWVPDRGARVAVLGSGATGRSAARALTELGCTVVVVDESAPDPQAVAELVGAGAQVLSSAAELQRLAAQNGLDLVITSPGVRPGSPLATAAGEVPVWGDVELAWRLRPAGQRWAAVTGTNGKTTTTSILAGILAAAGLRSIAAGNIGVPLLDVVTCAEPYEVIAVELSSFQLHWAPSVRPTAGAVLNVAEDHLDWHGSMAAYANAKAAVWHPDGTSIANLDDEGSAGLFADAPGRRVGFTLDIPQPGEVGIVEDLAVDRAFSAGGPGEAEELFDLSDLSLAGPHNTSNALAASALARAIGVAAAAVRTGVRGAQAGAHRSELVGESGGVRWVNDSKATNPHAAAPSISAMTPVVWIAGGLAKGATFGALVERVGRSLRAAVLIGTCADEIAAELTRHAPDVPVVRAASMDDAVREAARLARPGDTVLLAPAAASMDMFRSYAHRGEAFAASVRELLDGSSDGEGGGS